MAMTSLSSAHELDAGHLRAVAPAVAGLQDARVATGPRGELRPDLAEQLVGGLALVHVPHGESARVQRAVLRLRDQLLDERAQLLGLRLGRLDGALLDERGRQVAEQREALLTGAAQLPPGLPVTHGILPYSSSSSSGAFAAARLGGVPQSVTRTPSPVSSYRIPKFSPSRSSRSAISCRDFLPKFLTWRI